MTADISVIIPVLNENEKINKAVKMLFDQRSLCDTGSMEIIVVDGSLKGETLNCIQSDMVKGVVSMPGRGRQMNAGAAVASGSVLLFLHCDTALPGAGVKKILHTIKKTNCDAGAFDLSIDADGFAYRIIEKTASVRSRLTKIPYGDQGIFVRRDFFFKIGQFREIPIMEDVEFMHRIKKQGGKLAFVDGCVKTSPRRWEKEGKLYGTLRNWTIIILYFFGVNPEKLARLYKNH